LIGGRHSSGYYRKNKNRGLGFLFDVKFAGNMQVN
jgi:hypothetical protein